MLDYYSPEIHLQDSLKRLIASKILPNKFTGVLGSVDISSRQNQQVIVMPPGNGGIQTAGMPSLASGFRQSMPE
jgi:hypothetical protein